MPTITINKQRLWDDLMALAQFTEPNTSGWTRRFPSAAYQQGRQWLRAQMEAEGLITRIDAAGNLFGRREGTENLPPIHVGSHTDTVMGGGRFDGVLGVLGALEATRALRAADLHLRHPLVVADYLAEEATDYAVAALGSSALCTDQFNAEWLERTVGGITLRQSIIDMGGQPTALSQPLAQPGAIAASLELHIEQGPVLEARGVKLAAVSGVVGIYRALFELTGKTNHAGTTPMDLRHDALAAAARIICAIEDITRAHPGTVGTVGKLDVQPNQGNVIPGKVVMMAEMRSLDMQEIDGMWTEFMAMAKCVCAERGVDLQIVNATRMDSVIPPQWLHKIVHTVCQRLDPSAIVTPSGAGHDTSYLGLIAPAAMIFVPSVDGRSHAPEEYTAPEDLARGVQALAEAIVEVDKRD